jgi:hypothetical protein
MATSNHDCAARLAAAGLAIFPCDPKKRTPLFEGWRTSSSSDVASVEGWWKQWPGAVPALDLAKAGLLVLDGDRHHPGVDGVAALRRLLQGMPVAASPMVKTPRDGVHVYFRQPEPALGNARDGLPDGIDVRGAGGYAIAPGARLANRRSYVPIPGKPGLAAAFMAQSIPVVPADIIALLKPVRPQREKAQQPNGAAGARERAYAKGALRRIAGELAGAPAGTRNSALNKSAFALGTMVVRGWISAQEVEDALTAAMERNGYAADKGHKAIAATLASGLKAGSDHPHDDLPEQGIRLDDFVSHAPSRTYFFLPCREPWPGASVNTRLPKIEVTTADGELKEVSPSAWLDLHRSVEQMTWYPGEPVLIPNKLFVAAGGWVERRGVMSLNHYRAPLIEPGNAAEADPWIEHAHKVYPDSAEHLIRWLAHRVQRPAEKINHAIVLGGPQGIGKDTLLEPAKYAVGPWNVCEISPTALLGRFNGFLKAVILRVSEAHDLGEFNRFALYERLKAYTAAPPDGLRVDEKHLREYTIPNCCGVVITSNHQDALFLPEDDRRHYVAWSELTKDGFVAGYWRRLWGWYDAGGLNHVAAYLGELDLAGFDPKAPPPKTPAFWQIVGTGSAPEDAELADLLDVLGNPAAVTLAQLRTKADQSFDEWLADRRNRRVIPHRMSSCGYVPVRNPNTDDGLWRIKGVRQVVYTKATLSHEERFRAAQKLAQ